MQTVDVMLKARAQLRFSANCFLRNLPNCHESGYLIHKRIASQVRPNQPACATPSSATKGTSA